MQTAVEGDLVSCDRDLGSQRRNRSTHSPTRKNVAVARTHDRASKTAGVPAP